MVLGTPGSPTGYERRKMMAELKQSQASSSETAEVDNEYLERQRISQQGLGFEASSSKENAETYSNSSFYSATGPHAEWQAKEVISATQLGPEISLLDIGCGTGQFASLLMAQCGVKVTGIEPDAARAAEAEERGLKMTVGLLDEETVSGLTAAGSTFDVILLKEMVHLLPDPVACYGMMARLIAPGGVIVTMNRPHDPDYPLFAKAKEIWATGPHFSDIKGYQESAGLAVEEKVIGNDIVMSKVEWKGMVTNKVWSIYIDLSDAEIEAGLSEIDAIYGEAESITFKDVFTMFLATCKF